MRRFLGMIVCGFMLAVLASPSQALILNKADNTPYIGELVFLLRGVGSGTVYDYPLNQPKISNVKDPTGGPGIGVLVPGQESLSPGTMTIPMGFQPGGGINATLREDTFGMFKVIHIVGKNGTTGFANDILWSDPEVGGHVNNPLNNSITGLYYGFFDIFVDDTTAGGPNNKGASFHIRRY